MNESLEAIAMVQGHSGQRINLLSVHSPFFSEKFRVRQSSFPRDETYGLTTQLRRSASSIPSNIAEGCGREGDAELARFCLIARGSARELEYQILLAHDLKLIPSGRYEELSQEITEIKRMLTVFVQKLTADRSPETCLGVTAGSLCFVGFVVQGADEAVDWTSIKDTTKLGGCSARGAAVALGFGYYASAMGTSLKPWAKALAFKLDSSRSARLCSNFAAPRSTHAGPLVSIR